MVRKRKYEVRFDPDAYREYLKLDNSVVQFVDKALEELEYRADSVGKVLSNKPATKLAGCKEIKLRDVGIRIVFRVSNESVDILLVVWILTVERRDKETVFKIADTRFQRIKKFPKEHLLKLFQRSKKWEVAKKEEE